MKNIRSEPKNQVMISEVAFFKSDSANRFAAAIRRRGGAANVRGKNVILGAVPASVVKDAELAIGATAAHKWTR